MKSLLSAAIFFAVAISAAGNLAADFASEPFEESMLTAPDGSVGDSFGSSVAISSDTLVIGAPDATVAPHPYQGAAYVFTKSNDGWRLAAKLTAAGGTFEFGYSVAISGDTIVVGAIGTTVGSNVNQGAVYVFVKPATGWASTAAFSARLTESDGRPDDLFGISVAIDGDTVVVAPRNQTSDTDVLPGAVCVFVKPPGGWVSTSAFTAKLKSSDAVTFGYFGNSVAVSGDAVVVGASNAIYVFVKPAGGWATTAAFNAKLTVSNGMTSSGLGDSVAISGDTIVAEAGGAVAYVFVRPSTGWRATSAFDAELTVPSPYLGEYGYSLAFSNDAVVLGTISIRDAFIAERGAAYVFRKPAAGWGTTSAFDARLAVCGDSASNLFGLSVAASEDAVVVGAPYEPPLPGQPSAFPGPQPRRTTPDSAAGQDAAYVFTGDLSAIPPTRGDCIESQSPVLPAPMKGRQP